MTAAPPRFWDLQTTDELRLVRGLLARRFPSPFAALAEALEAVDPFEIVYPNNPDEYLDVVMELLVMLAPVDAEFHRLTRDALEAAVQEALVRCFDEAPNPQSVQRIVDRLRNEHDAPRPRP